MEQSEHLLETDINKFGDQLLKKDDSSCQSTSLNETGVTIETKVAEELEGKRDPRNDSVFHEKERELSSISITSGDSKNCLSAIADMYSSSDDETCPENSTEPLSIESKIAEDASSKEMGINNFLNTSVDPISVQGKGASLEEENNNLNSNNSTDNAPQITMTVEPELLRKPENFGGTLIESDSDRQIFMKTENDTHTLVESKSDGHTTIERINDGSKLMESESDRQILIGLKVDEHTVMETEIDGHSVTETESDGHTPIEPTKDGCLSIKPENYGCTLLESQNDGHILTQPGSNGQTLIKQESDRHTLIEQGSDGCFLAKAKNNGHTEDNNDGHILKIESCGHALLEPLNDGKSKSDGHKPMETDNEGNILIKSERGGHTLMDTKSNKHILPEPENDGQTLIEPDSKLSTLIEPKGEEGSLVGLERHGDTATCSDIGHQVYAMSSIDKELENIGESESTSQIGRQTKCETEDSSSLSSSDDESSSSESESSESSSE